jgi:hypothetical protein
MFMRVNSRCAHQVRPPPSQLAGPADLSTQAVVDVRNPQQVGRADASRVLAAWNVGGLPVLRILYQTVRWVQIGGSQPTLSAAVAARSVILDRRDGAQFPGARQLDANGLDSS